MGAIYCLTTPVNAVCVLRWLDTIFTMSRIFFSRLATPYLVSSNFNFNLLCAAVALYVLFRLCFLVLERSLIVRCMGLSYEESVRISMKWLSFRRSLFTLTSCSQRIIWMSSTSGFLAWLSFFFFVGRGREMSINRRKGIRNVTKGKISLKFDSVIC
jgi:hypothetical protein